MTPDDNIPTEYASPACFAHEIDPAYANPLFIDAQHAKNVVDWRGVERIRLLAERAALSIESRHIAVMAIANHLDQLLAQRFASLKGLTISGWWPIKAELDLRFWLDGLAARGARGTLPLVVTRSAPLMFRAWTSDTRMERGMWNIFVPAEGPYVTPDIILTPVVGWDAGCYRLGYGGGYFDRTLATMKTKPFVIGVGLQAARIASIHPQPHDIPMQVVVTETGMVWPT